MHTDKLVFAQLMEHLPLATADVALALISLVVGAPLGVRRVGPLAAGAAALTRSFL